MYAILIKSVYMYLHNGYSSFSFKEQFWTSFALRSLYFFRRKSRWDLVKIFSNKVKPRNITHDLGNHTNIHLSLLGGWIYHVPCGVSIALTNQEYVIAKLDDEREFIKGLLPLSFLLLTIHNRNLSLYPWVFWFCKKNKAGKVFIQ